jgi:hypothetical protein
LAHRYDAELGPIAARGSPTADAVEALGVAAAAAVRRLGPVRSPWMVISAMTGTLLLSPLSPAVVVIVDHAAVGAIITPSPEAVSVDDAVARCPSATTC